MERQISGVYGRAVFLCKFEYRPQSLSRLSGLKSEVLTKPVASQPHGQPGFQPRQNPRDSHGRHITDTTSVALIGNRLCDAVRRREASVPPTVYTRVCIRRLNLDSV